MTLASILKSKSGALIKIEVGTPIGTVTEILHRNNIGAVLVMRDDELLGVLSDRVLSGQWRSTRRVSVPCRQSGP